MHNVETLMRNLIDISDVKLSGGWHGWAAVRSAGQEQLSKAGWEKLLAEPEKLFEGAQEMLTGNGSNTVTIKNLDIGGREIKTVLKRRRRGWGIRDIFRSLRAAQAIKNFIAAYKLRQYGLPVASPLAAIYHKRFIFCDQGIYISEYIEGTNLYKFFRDTREGAVERYRTTQKLSEQIAGIFAELHKNNLWHRDAKASNFVVSKNGNGEYRVVITDVDGIKRYFSHSDERQMQGLWQLAASVMGLPGITRTDYLRTFKKYCDKAAIAGKHRGDIFRRLSQKAQAKYEMRQAKLGR